MSEQARLPLIAEDAASVPAAPEIAAQGETSQALSTQPHRCARPYCPNEARRGKRWGKYCSDKCRMEVWAYRHRRKAHLCGPGKRRDPEKEFARWLDTRDGQTIYVEAMRRALRLKAMGFRHYGIGAIYEAIRYDSSVAVGPDGDGYKLNDHHRSRLARLIMAKEPDLAGFFETRQLRSGR